MPGTLNKQHYELGFLAFLSKLIKIQHLGTLVLNIPLKIAIKSIEKEVKIIQDITT